MSAVKAILDFLAAATYDIWLDDQEANGAQEPATEQEEERAILRGIRLAAGRKRRAQDEYLRQQQVYAALPIIWPRRAS
jgi:hypothetical protein